MKKLLSVFVLVVALLSCSRNAHLEFKGIPVTGSLKDFCSKLEAKGFVLDPMETTANAVCMDGTLAGESIKAYIYSTPKTNTVYSVVAVINVDRNDGIVETIIADEYKQWDQLTDKYFHLKDMLTDKYGAPATCTEVMDPVYCQGNELTALRNDKLTYRSDYKTDAGTIAIQIAQMEHSLFSRDYLVVLFYDDTQNCALHNKEIVDDL